MVNKPLINLNKAGYFLGGVALGGVARIPMMKSAQSNWLRLTYMKALLNYPSFGW